MPSERVQRQIDALLDEAEGAIKQSDWAKVQERASQVLTLDPENADGLFYLSASARGLATAPADSPVDPPAPEASVQTPSSTPQPATFAGGRYEVKRFLGEGGKKKVYLAHDTLLDRDVAFALIKTEGLDDVGRQRITREAQAMGRLGSHPHIVSVFDLGEEVVTEATPLPGTRNPTQPFMVTELMGGGDVEGAIEKAQDHKLTLERAVEIATQTIRGLEFAHSKGVVHRDLKPGNVWLTSDGVAKIGDFGLAVAIDRSRLTREGMMVGTVSYMPPEQATGGEITPRSDLYSLGAMLYEMACGRPPFVGDDSVAIIGQHLNTPPVSPSWHRPEVPVGLEGLILRLLEKDPTKRPESATAVRQALESIDLSLGDDVGAGSLRPAPTDGPRAMDNPLYRRTFVGRENELSQLKSAFDGALSGQGGLVMVVGEPGIGKTALCEQLATYATLRGGKTLVGHCYEEGSLSLPYLAFVEAMRSYVLAREPDALRSELGTGAADVARIVSEVRDKINVELRPSSDPSTGSGQAPEDDRWRLYQSISGFLKNASTVQPLLIVLEDLHWADRGTLDLLVHVARNFAGTRLLIIGTYRDVEVDRSHPLSSSLAELRRGSTFGRVLLRGLTPDEVQRMLNAITGQELRWALAEGIHRQTEGNPLFIQEVVRYLVEEGFIQREGDRWVGRWRSTGEQPPEMRIPEGLRDVIGKRLSRLSPECNRLLSIAAVIGRDFRLDTLDAVGSIPEEEALGKLEEALKVGVLEEQARVGGVQYRFAHAFFRQTLYEELSAARRLRLHQQVARALEIQYQGRVADHAAELAEHFTQSTDPADLQKAVSYGETAAQRATSVFDYGEAARLLERAIDVQEVLDPDDRAKRCDLLLALGDALMPAGEPQRAAGEVSEEAFTLAEALGDRERASRACRTALTALRQYGAAAITTTAVYRGWAERGDRYAAPDSVDRVYVDVEMSFIAGADRQWGQGRTLKAKSLELARRLGDVDALWYAAFGILGGPGYNTPDHYHELLELTEEFAQRPRAGVSARTLGMVLRYCGLHMLASAERRRAEELWQEANTLAERTQEPRGLIQSIGGEAVLATLDGRLDAALQAGEHVVSRAEELGSPILGLQFRTTFTLPALLYLGRAEDALNQLSQAAQMAGTEVFGLQRAARVVCLAMLDRRAEAQIALQESRLLFGIDQPDPDNDVPMSLLVGLCHAAVLLGDRETASLTAQRLIPVAAVAFGIGGTSSVARLLGGAAALLGEPEQARAYYHQALEVCAKIRFRPEIALTHLQLAELLLEEAEKPAPFGRVPSPLRGEGQAVAGSVRDEGETQQATAHGSTGSPRAEELRREAMEHLDFAIAEFREMKMQPSLERALRHKELLKA